MTGTFDAIRRHAENDLRTIRNRLDSGRRRGVSETRELAAIARDLTDTIRNLNETERHQPYSDTNIGYGAAMRRGGGSRTHSEHHGDTHGMARTMESIDRILPHLEAAYADFEIFDDMEMRRGRGRGRVKPGPPRDRRLKRSGTRYEMDGDMDMYADHDWHDEMDMDDDHDMEMRRGVPGTGRGRRRAEHERSISEAYARGLADGTRHTTHSPHSDRITQPSPQMPRYDTHTSPHSDGRTHSEADMRRQPHSDGTSADTAHGTAATRR